MTPRNVRCLGIAFTLLLGTTLAPAAFAGIETSYDNDTNGMVPGATATDRSYTAGLHAHYFLAPGMMPRWADRLAARLGGASAERRLSFAAGQELYTPYAISLPQVVPNDQPFAAWLFAGATLSGSTARHARALELRAGVVGPLAQGEELQTWWHRREHIRLPRGWRNQLANEPALRATLDERWRPWGARRHADLVPHVRLTAGNVLTEAAAGATLRLGVRIADDFGPDAPSGPEAGVRGLRMYVFARAEGRAVAHDIFLDGNTFRPSPAVHRLPFVGETQMGAELRHGAYGVRYLLAHTSPQFRERPEAHEYGSVTFSF